MNNALLNVHNVSKRFGGVVALRGVHLKLFAGQVTALVGENGAGKSTLVKILTGIHQPDGGSISLNGNSLHFTQPRDATAAGIAAIHQEPSMFDELTVAENIFITHQPRHTVLRTISWRKMIDQARQKLADIGASLDPSAKLGQLSIAERHLVSLARALSTDASLVIFDEPTAALSTAEISHLYTVIEQLRNSGKAILFITHKFDEIFRICDRYVVLRDGELAGSGFIKEIDEAELIRQMVGRTLRDIYPKSPSNLGQTVLAVRQLSHPTEFNDISFTLRQGEVLGFYGLVGSGRTEVMESLFGLKDHSTGDAYIDGKLIDRRSSQNVMDAGIAYVPEDRQTHGAILPFPISHNISLPILAKLGRMGLINPRRENALASDYGTRVQIKASHWMQSVEQLSGGNQQKVVIAKWLATEPRVLILDEPTKGIDVGSKSAVHQRIGELVTRGLSVLLVSSELEEVLAIADRLIIMAHGKIVAELDRSSFDRETVVGIAAGLVPDKDNVVHACRSEQ